MRWLSLRTTTVVLLVAGAVICSLLAWGALRNLWGGNGDSPPAAYIVIGGLWLLLACGCLVNAARFVLGR
jgi:hypothetical protein